LRASSRGIVRAISVSGEARALSYFPQPAGLETAGERRQLKKHASAEPKTDVPAR
jgi:hypothetical protein